MNEDQHEGELDARQENKEVYNAPAETLKPIDVRKELDLIAPINLGSEEKTFNVTAAQEETRAKIALYFTRAFLFLVGLALAAPFVLNFGFPEIISNPLGAAKELVTILASVLAGPFGFIVGFYFKQGQDNNG